MPWSEPAVGGAVLAATVFEDREAGAAALVPAVGEAVRARAAELAAADGVARRRAVRSLAASLKPAPSPEAELPRRARAVLATDLPREQGNRWLQDAPKPRAGWSPPAALRATLRRLAGPRARRDPGIAQRERGVGRESLARAAQALDADAREALLARCGAQEAAAVEALRSLGSDGEPEVGPAPEARLRLEAARRIAARGELTRVLGALSLGWGGELDGDADSRPWRRAGRELRELWEAGCLE